MSGVQEAYDEWAVQYDTNNNKTRDMEGVVMRQLIGALCLNNDKGICLEIGCGTGKNTVWLSENFERTVSVDFSNEMLAFAKEKVGNKSNVTLLQADITENWSFIPHNTVDMATFSLVLEHIENLDFIFQQLMMTVKSGGLVYIGELHPFKQYAGTKARFGTGDTVQELTCFVHNVSDFTRLAAQYGFVLLQLEEFFDGGDRMVIPRILGLVFRRV